MNNKKLFVLTDDLIDKNYNNSNTTGYGGKCEVLPGVYIYLTKLPNKFNRFFLSLLLGWKFEIFNNPPPLEGKKILYG
jgi:hypothetical protein